tara:strand:+ start:1536 stop:2285 length:750 start_codon:yes stop_codon:yes gene_type:complete
MTYSIGITTYKYRFDKWFKPLVSAIKRFRPDIEIMVAINGENNEPFDEDFRRSVLQFVATQPNTYVTLYPTYRGLCKLWNNLLINSSNHKMLVLNDDLTIHSDSFFDELEKIIHDGVDIFKINSSWSHYVVDRRSVDKIGWFDERFLSIGEEDGDFEWRLGSYTGGGVVPSVGLAGIDNHVDHENCLVGMSKTNKKYSQFNLDFAFGTKYRVDPNGENYGIMNRSVICESPTPPMHQTESFYWENLDKL